MQRDVPFNSITAKRFTGQYHEASLPGGEGLSFYNARWYDPKLGSFLSADSIVPAPLDPQSLNRYAYVGGNPINHRDPTGHACDDGPQTYAACYGNKPVSHAVMRAANTPGGRGTVTYQQARRFSRMNASYLYSATYGWIDRGHANPGLAKTVIIGVTQRVMDGGGMVTLPAQAAGPRIGKEHLLYYERSYWISPEVSTAQISGIALGIFEDAGKRWEEWQGRIPIGSSKYSIEDLPSNYIGFVREINGWSEEYTLSFLGELTAVDRRPYCAWAECGSPRQRLPRNEQHQPLVMAAGKWTYVAWPNELTITPIGSSPTTWQFVGDATTGILAPFLRNSP